MLNTEKVRQLMRENNMNATELAAATDVSKSMVSKILKGKAQPSFALANEIAKVFGCTIDELVKEVT